MKYVWKRIFFCVCYFLLTKCLIPTLTVRKVDQRLIDRRRQDTLEICRLFNEENKYLETDNKNNKLDQSPRFKRALQNDINNSLLSKKDAARVENIVDKLYDEMDQNGERVTYRRRNLRGETKIKGSKNKKYRRFDFAPAELLGPSLHVETKHIDMDNVKIPWIKKWKFGLIPFFIDPNTYDSLLSKTILKTFNYIEKVTCIRLTRLRERPTDIHSLEKVEWLYITNPSGLRQCVHSNERKPNTGVQVVVLGYDCLSQGEILHEFMHVLGFSHEHTRPDRDQHIIISWDNIKPGYKKYFEIRKNDTLLNLPYDYSSVLHYPPRAFSRNGQLTLLTQSEVKIGQREALSELDVEKIGMIYGAECVERNKDYLLKTCPSAVKTSFKSVTLPVKFDKIEDYFKNRLWPYAIVNYKIRDKIEFTAEERENIKAVLKHIEKETCIKFKDIDTELNESDDENDDNQIKDHLINLNANDIYNPDDEATTSVPKISMTSPYDIRENSNIEINKVENPKVTSDMILRQRKIYHVQGNTKNKLHYGSARSNKKQRGYKQTRRHSNSVMMLERSSEPGCTCPTPGQPNGITVLKINADCFNTANDLLHMFVHVLGLDHQHNMHDRDSYIHIMWDKLTPVMKKELDHKLPPAASAGFPYDYQSVMHYPWLQIQNGTTNIIYPVWNDGWAMGHWHGLSLTDVNKLNYIYEGECAKRRNETDG